MGNTHNFGADTDDLNLLDEENAKEESGTIYTSLVDALKAKVQRPPLVLRVPERPGVSLVFDTNIDFETYQAWVKRSMRGPDGKKTDTPDYMRLALVVISNKNTGILLNRKEQVGPKGPYTIVSPEIHEMLGVNSVHAAIRALYVVDGHAIQTMRKIVEAAGYSVDGDILDEDEDPLGN